MKNRFQKTESRLGQRLLSNAQTLKLTIHNFGETTEASFSIEGSVGILRDDPACRQDELDEALRALCGDEEPCPQAEIDASRKLLCDLLCSFVEGK